MLWMFQRVNYGPITNEKNRSMPDLTPREWALMVPTIAMAIVMGVVPGVFLRPMEPSVARIVERVSGSQPARVSNTPHPVPGALRPVPALTPAAGAAVAEPPLTRIADRAAGAASTDLHHAHADRRAVNAENHE
jgi:NADH-quinone oxidoreductase subunit M